MDKEEFLSMLEKMLEGKKVTCYSIDISCPPAEIPGDGEYREFIPSEVSNVTMHLEVSTEHKKIS